MRAAQMKERPDFQLMRQTDIQSIYYMKMPRWLFFDPRYAELSLEAKVEPEDDPEYECAPFSSDRYESEGTRTADSEVLDDMPSAQGQQDRSFKNHEICGLRTSDIAVPEPQDPRPSKKERT